MFGHFRRVTVWIRAQIRVRTDPVGFARSLGVKMGEGCRIFSNETTIFGSHPFLVHMGHRCYVTEGVRFITHDGGVLLFKDRAPELDIVSPIILGDNVYVGFRAIILPGVRIGNNCIIGAGAVVARDVPDNSVAVGVPARVVKTTVEYEQAAHNKSIGTGGMFSEAKTARLKELFGGEGR